MITEGVLTDYSRMILQSRENAAPWWQNAILTEKIK